MNRNDVARNDNNNVTWSIDGWSIDGDRNDTATIDIIDAVSSSTVNRNDNPATIIIDSLVVTVAIVKDVTCIYVSRCNCYSLLM